jgi:putative transposase
VFGSVGATKAFLVAPQETVDRFGWRLGAYVVMRNHYHLAAQTPQTHLSAGMQWLQVTIATRFNRMRKENGPLLVRHSTCFGR